MGEAREVAERLLQLGAVLGGTLAAIYAAGAPHLSELFTDDVGVSAAVASVLPLAVGMLPINSLVYVLDGVLLGCADFRFLAGAFG